MNSEIAEQMKPIYTQVGATVQGSQQLELGIGFALTLLKQLNSSEFNDSKFDDSMDLFSKKTLGWLITEFKKHCKLDENATSTFKLALDERNYIIHKIFSKDIEEFVNREGREKMKARIIQARDNIDSGIKIIDSMVEALLEISGISFEEIMNESRSSIEI